VHTGVQSFIVIGTIKNVKKFMKSLCGVSVDYFVLRTADESALEASLNFRVAEPSLSKGPELALT